MEESFIFQTAEILKLSSRHVIYYTQTFRGGLNDNKKGE
jgi:hypothetical protein